MINLYQNFFQTFSLRDVQNEHILFYAFLRAFLGDDVFSLKFHQHLSIFYSKGFLRVKNVKRSSVTA